MDVKKWGAVALGFVLVQCGSSSTPSAELSTNDANGKSIFNTLCAQCHGTDGKKGVGGAKDLSVTSLSADEINAIIYHGKGTMPPYGKSLSETEITAVTQYVLTMKQ